MVRMAKSLAGVFTGRILMLSSLAVLILLTGCSPSSQPNAKLSTTRAAPTATPMSGPLVVTVKQLALNGYTVEDAFATNTGLVFTATGTGAQGEQVSELYYYDLNTGATTLADSAPWDPHRCTGGCSGTTDTIWIEAVAGDMVVYARLGVGGAAGSLRALDVGRWRQFTLDTSTAYGAGGESLPVVAATDGQHVAWERLAAGPSGFGASAIHMFDTSAGAESVSFPTDAGYSYWLGFAGGALVYSKAPESAARGDQIPIFSQPLAGGNAVQVATGEAPVLLSGDDSYLAWDRMNSDGSGTTSVLSLSTPSAPAKTYSCTRPRLAGRYMACVVFDHNLQLWDLTTGGSASFGADGSVNYVSISAGLVVWWDGKVVNYVTLPQ